MKENEQLIGEILVDNLPKNILEALRVMASLTYPISDQRSFLAQLETLVKDPGKSSPAEQVEAFDFARGMFTARDFPILTPVSGLEKTFAYFSDPYWQDFGPDLDIADPGDYVEIPPIDPCAEYHNLFIGACADRACEVYQQFVNHPRVTKLGAFFAGKLEGESCMRSGGWLHPSTSSSSGLTRVDPSDELIRWWRGRRRLRRWHPRF